MKAFVAVVGVVLAVGNGATNAYAQTTAAAPASFEVTSVKPSDPNAAGRFGAIPMVVPQGGGRFTATNMPLRMLIRIAYGVPDHQIVGGPSWQLSSKWDITAKAPETTTAADTPELLALVKTLLADRFKLKTHTETREMPTYALVVARSDGRLGPNLKPSTSDCSSTSAEFQKRAEAIAKGGIAALASMLPKPGETIKCAMTPAIDPANPSGGFGLKADGLPLTQLIALLTQVTSRPVNDKTGLTGLYDWELRFDPQVFLALLPQLGINIPTAATANLPASDSPALLDALQQQLGLKLDPQRGPVDVLVIDSAEMPQPD